MHVKERGRRYIIIIILLLLCEVIIMMMIMWAHTTLWGSLPFIPAALSWMCAMMDGEEEEYVATMKWKKRKSR
jgi:hypothetical protein